MLTARLVATQVMDLWHISGAILEDTTGEWLPIATFSEDVPLEHDQDGDHDPVYSLLRAVRLWSEMTIQR
jgi:hypothetical protein